MKVNDKIQEFRLMIESALLPEIDNNYIMCGLPNYSNIGDMLIYQGILDLFKKVKYKCLDRCFYNDYHFSSVDSKTIFIIFGGGFMGDTWRSTWEPVVKLIELYIHNKFIIFPQSIYYSDKYLAEQDSKLLSKNKRIVICARDNDSFRFANETFKNRVILVPDMAFYMNSKWYNKNNGNPTKVLYLRRIDKEFVPNSLNSTGMDESDWPTIDSNSQTYIQIICEKVFWYYRKIVSKYPYMRSTMKPLVYGLFFSKLYKPLMIREGVRFINQYKTVYTTRLHGMILSVMMSKKVVILDNSYGKISSYYRTWLCDIDIIKLLDPKG